MEGIWRTRTDQEIDELIGHEDIVSFLKSLRMRWLEHVERMNNIRMPEMILSAKVEDGRRRGRPRKRWLDDVECNTRSLGIRNWRLKARNRI
jgi:hypothetical protein